MKLVSDQPTPLEKLLLDASRAEEPSAEHKARMRALLGIGVPLSAPLAAPAPAAFHGAGGSAAATSKSALFALAAVGAGVLALVGAFMFTRGSDDPAVGKAPATVVVPPAAEALPRPAPATVGHAELPEVAPLPPTQATAPAQAPRAARVEVPAGGATDLSEQIRLIEAARSGLSTRNVKATNAALDAYAARFPRGSFGQEAQVLRIRAVDQAGDAARATAMAKSFIARFPKSPHVARLKPIAERGASR